jgi:hypothetical protein
MFTQLSPQKAQHSDGYIVQSGGRHYMEYIAEGLRADVEVERGPVTGVFWKTIRFYNAERERIEVSAELRGLVLQRLLDGMKFLGMKAELDPEPVGQSMMAVA